MHPRTEESLRLQIKLLLASHDEADGPMTIKNYSDFLVLYIPLGPMSPGTVPSWRTKAAVFVHQNLLLSEVWVRTFVHLESGKRIQ